MDPSQGRLGYHSRMKTVDSNLELISDDTCGRIETLLYFVFSDVHDIQLPQSYVLHEFREFKWA